MAKPNVFEMDFEKVSFFVLSDNVDGYRVLCESVFVLCTWKLVSSGNFKNQYGKRKLCLHFYT